MEIEKERITDRPRFRKMMGIGHAEQPQRRHRIRDPDETGRITAVASALVDRRKSQIVQKPDERKQDAARKPAPLVPRFQASLSYFQKDLPALSDCLRGESRTR